MKWEILKNSVSTSMLKSMIKKLIFVLTGLIFGICSHVDGQIDINKYDYSKNQKIELQELRVLILHIRGIPISSIDKITVDGRIDSTELAMAQALTVQYERCIESKLNKGAPYEFSEIEDIVNQQNFCRGPDNKSKELSLPFGLLLRETYEEYTIVNKVGSFKKAKAASFSYARNFDNDVNVWAAKGALIKPFVLGKNFGFIPSVVFNRLSSRRDTTDEEANSLVFRGGLNRTLNLKSAVLNLRGFVSLATDFDLESDVRALEFQVEPIFLKYMGVYTRLFKGLEARGRIFIHYELGKVESVGDKELDEDDEFYRIGPKIDLSLRTESSLGSAGPVLVNIKWERLYGINDTNDLELFTGKIAVDLDAEDHLKFQVEYSKGRILLTQEKINNLTIGLGIKF